MNGFRQLAHALPSRLKGERPPLFQPQFLKMKHQAFLIVFSVKLLVPLSAFATEGLSPAPSAENDYVRVWSSTIGVENVICSDNAAPDGETRLDFLITTTNVVDNFIALIHIDEINGDAWELKSPRSGVAAPMHPGERIDYILHDKTGVEPDKTGHIALYRVDVCIDGVPEIEEETIGATVFRGNASGNFDAVALAPFLTAVTIRCFTPDPEDLVSLEVAFGTLLVLGADGQLERASMHYAAGELGELSFYLLGNRLSQAPLNQYLRVTHDATGCHDEARYTVKDKPPFQIRTVEFHNNVPIESDFGEAFDRPQFNDHNADGVLQGGSEHGWPVCAVRNTTIALKATIAHSNPSLSSPVFVRAVSDAFSISSTLATVTPTEIVLPMTDADGPLANSIDFKDPLRINWSVSTDNGATWHDAGSSTNRFYVVWSHPVSNSRLETLFFIGCRGAKGVTGTTGNNNKQVLDAIWDNQFKTRRVARACDNKVLTYYGFRDNNGNGTYDDGDVYMNTPETCPNPSYDLLIQNLNGQCDAWASLMEQVLKAQGVSTISESSIGRITLHPNSSATTMPSLGFAIKNWGRSGMGIPFPPDEGRSFLIVLSDAGIIGSVPPRSQDNNLCWDMAGVHGQGNSPNPPSLFTVHKIVRVGNLNYDPSYGNGGNGPYNTMSAYEHALLAGLVTKHDFQDQKDLVWLYVPQEDADVFQTRILDDETQP